MVNLTGGAFLVHEKNELIQGVREISTALRDMKNYVTGEDILKLP